jgi:predicted ATP-grasp superfamily ATP-dependent carboligase
MLEAVTGRKKATLPIALDIFNKLRNQKVPTMALQDAVEKQDASVEDQIEKIEILLNNP